VNKHALTAVHTARYSSFSHTITRAYLTDLIINHRRLILTPAYCGLIEWLVRSTPQRYLAFLVLTTVALKHRGWAILKRRLDLTCGPANYRPITYSRINMRCCFRCHRLWPAVPLPLVRLPFRTHASTRAASARSHLLYQHAAFGAAASGRRDTPVYCEARYVSLIFFTVKPLTRRCRALAGYLHHMIRASTLSFWIRTLGRWRWPTAHPMRPSYQDIGTFIMWRYIMTFLRKRLINATGVTTGLAGTERCLLPAYAQHLGGTWHAHAHACDPTCFPLPTTWRRVPYLPANRGWTVVVVRSRWL